ncbi:DUF2269 family protein [Ktedonosporobacter rubrisoli]|uniref:DUF2269 family protein n=1 Tax=Ktedonosporobacter rubrisoli TaxID=2509675 RepID=A0A4V0Z0D5_KTERU|nr:DUF2269 family protein [Ktedonosporobacter rubrisoli]QBD82841.1 DUF2269 family protein [Ktedonosporobacter rubrisoli]
MILYPLLLFLHIAAAVGLFMGLGIELVSVMRVRRARRSEQIREILDLAASTRALAPLSALLVLAAGFSLCLLWWSFSLPWIDVSLGVFLLTAFTGVTITGRRLACMHRWVQGHPDGPLSPSSTRHIDDPVLVTTLCTTMALLLSVLFIMTTKPLLPGSLASVFIGMLVGAGVSVLLSCYPGDTSISLQENEEA